MGSQTVPSWAFHVPGQVMAYSDGLHFNVRPIHFQVSRGKTMAANCRTLETYTPRALVGSSRNEDEGGDGTARWTAILSSVAFTLGNSLPTKAINLSPRDGCSREKELTYLAHLTKHKHVCAIFGRVRLSRGKASLTCPRPG